jgi:HSP20 family molecular chaperone IbpA
MDMANETELQVQDAEKQEIEETEAERTRDRKAFVPRSDIYEDGGSIFIVADVSGVDENTLEITLEKGVLTINGYVEPKAPEGYTLAYAEYETGDYQRSFKLSNQIDLDKIEATVKDGVLRLHLPKVGPAQTKKIAVKAS